MDIDLVGPESEEERIMMVVGVFFLHSLKRWRSSYANRCFEHGMLFCENFRMHFSHRMRKSTMWFRNRADTNQAVQAQKMARGWKF